MKAFIASQTQIKSWFIHLASDAEFAFPVSTEGDNYRFETPDINNLSELFSYKPSLLPPGKKIFPDNEILFNYHKDAAGHYHFSQGPAAKPQILAGVRPCDLKGIFLLDTAFSDGIKDTHYLQRRAQTAIIAFNCLSPCDERCFCAAVQSLDFQSGADIFVTALPESDNCLLEVLSSRGEQLINSLQCITAELPQKLKMQALATRPSPFGKQFVLPLEQLADTIYQQDADAVYEQYAQRCFSCGTCNLVCPSCYCFETKDEFSLAADLQQGQGQKTRQWDACLNPGFAEVAGGHNFRAQPAARQRHRVRRKFAYLHQRFEHIFCTGCGRCGRQCTTGIDIFDIVNDVCQATDTLSMNKEQGVNGA